MRIQSSVGSILFVAVPFLAFVLTVLWHEEASFVATIVGVAVVVVFTYGTALTYANNFEIENHQLLVSNNFKLWAKKLVVNLSDVNKVVVEFGARGQPFITINYRKRQSERFGILGATDNQLEEMVNMLNGYGVNARICYKWKESSDGRRSHQNKE